MPSHQNPLWIHPASSAWERQEIIGCYGTSDIVRPPNSTTLDCAQSNFLSSDWAPSALVEPPASIVQLHVVNGVYLHFPLYVVVERDEEEYIARSPDISMLYGFGESLYEAVEMLKREIISLRADLMVQDSKLGRHLLVTKKFLARLFGDKHES